MNGVKGDMNKLTFDYHLHTARCKHATGSMEEYVRQALRLGLTEIAFTDHIPLPDKYDLAHRMAEHELDDYVEDVERLQKDFPQIKIKLGIEADFIDGMENFLEDILRQHPFDLVIMSVHFIRNWPQGNWVFNYDFPDKTITEIYDEYLDALLRGVQTGLFDIVGHLDLIKSPAQHLLEKNGEKVEHILDEVHRHSMAVEINSSGWRKEINQPYPAESIWPLLLEREIPLTIGSDAHAPEQVGFAFERLEKTLQRFKRIPLAAYQKRKMTVNEILL